MVLTLKKLDLHYKMVKCRLLNHLNSVYFNILIKMVNAAFAIGWITFLFISISIAII